MILPDTTCTTCKREVRHGETFFGPYSSPLVWTRHTYECRHPTVYVCPECREKHGTPHACHVCGCEIELT
jgi:hypothetical protein